MNLLYKSVAIFFLTLVSVIFVAPNYLEKDWLPKSKINLGLDLQGGSHILLEADVASHLNDQLNNISNNLKILLRNTRLGYRNLKVLDQKIVFEVRDLTQMQQVKKILTNLDTNIDFSIYEDKITLFFAKNKIQNLINQLLEQSIEIIRLRIDADGTKEPVLQRQGDKYILVQVPGAQNPDEVKNLLGKTAKLTFHLVDDSIDIARAMEHGVGPNHVILESSEHQGYYMVVNKNPELTGDMLINAQVSFQNGLPAVSFELSSAGGRIFAELTKNNFGKRLAIVLDDKLLSAPTINEPIVSGNGVISGNYTIESASELALLLRAGALPTPLYVIEERNVGPSLGSDSIESGKKAGIISIVGVMIFMVWIYGIFGLFANLALLIGILYIIAILGFAGATLTLPGIAGIILTVGMAVDANILIYERIREELKANVSKFYAVKCGFDSAFATIADSNITTLIAALLLYIFGSGVIKGFAVTLSIGILASMFSAVVVTKLFVDIWLKYAKKTARINF